MASIISLDSRLTAALPPAAKRKINDLIAAAQDAESAHMAMIGRRERLMEEVGDLRLAQSQAVARARELSPAKPEAADATAAEFEPAIAGLNDEIARLAGQLRLRLDRRNSTAALIGCLRGFLETCASHVTPLAPYQHPPPRLNGTAPPVALGEIREQITKFERELLTLQRAALPGAELKLKIRELIHRLALAGEPQLITERGQCRLEWPPGSQVPMGTEGPGAACVAAWLLADEMISRLDEKIDRQSGAGLNSTERARREGQLKDKLMTLQRTEESIIEKFESEFDLIRRPAADPLAVLNLRNGLTNGKTS
jgi:hypothetical protein